MVKRRYHRVVDRFLICDNFIGTRGGREEWDDSIRSTAASRAACCLAIGPKDRLFACATRYRARVCESRATDRPGTVFYRGKVRNETRERHSIDSGRIGRYLCVNLSVSLWEQVTSNFSKFSRKSSKKILRSQRSKGRMLSPVSVTRRHIFLLNRAEFYRFICNLRIAYCRLSINSLA